VAQAYPQQFPQLAYDGAALLAQQYKGAFERARAQRLAALLAQLSNGVAPGFRTVRALADSQHQHGRPGMMRIC
jgi:hypothetical protein